MDDKVWVRGHWRGFPGSGVTGSGRPSAGGALGCLAQLLLYTVIVIVGLLLLLSAIRLRCRRVRAADRRARGGPVVRELRSQGTA